MSRRIRQTTARDGYQLNYPVWGPDYDERPDAPLIVLINGIASHSGWFFPILDPLVKAGFRVLGADRRGTGANVEARGDTPSASTLVDDLRRIISAENSGGNALFLVGWCWGAVLALNLLGDDLPTLRGVVLAAPGLFPTRTVVCAVEAQQDVVENAAEDAAVITSPVPDEMFTTGEHLSGFIKSDALRLTHFTPRFLRAMSQLGMRARSRISRIDVPVMILLGERDEATDNAATLTAFERMRLSPTIHVLSSAHGLQFDAQGDFARHLVRFVRDHGTERHGHGA